MIKIHFSFWVAAGIFWTMGMTITFVMLIASVTIHEMAHVLLAKAFGCQIRKFEISAMGEMVQIAGLNKLPPIRRSLVIIAGPAANLLLWGLSCYFDFGGPNFRLYNLILFGFNMLPTFPLDGARLIQLWAGNIFGIMRANRLLISAGQICYMALIVLGIFQAYFYAPNFTMLLAGLLFWHRSKNLKLELTGEFYIAITDKDNKPFKTIKAREGDSFYDIVNRMGWDHKLRIIMPDGKILNEADVLKSILLT